jgi:glucokinase
MRIIGAVDIGGTKIAVGAIAEDGTIAWRATCSTDPERGFDDAVRRIRMMLRDASMACGEFDGIGIACPGPLDPFTGVLGEVGTLPGWEHRSLSDELEREFGATIAVENDADAAALGEMQWGAAKGARNFIFVTVSTGIGGGIIHEASSTGVSTARTPNSVTRFWTTPDRFVTAAPGGAGRVWRAARP